jgi:stearoyl-CoA desaturase (delta-9 desaturase)
LGFGLGFGFHRAIIHKSINAFLWPKRIAALVACLGNTGSAITWGTSHYLHHAQPDTEIDPHSPTVHGYKILLGFYNTDTIMKNYRKIFPALRHIATDKFIIWTHNYYYLIILSYFAGTFFVAGFKGLLFFGLAPSGLSYLSILLINFFNHGQHGYRTYETLDKSKNVWWLLPLVFGENWHNNHHRFPSAKSNQVKWWEFDPIGYLCIIFDKDSYMKLNISIKLIKNRIKSKRKDYVY